MLLSLALALALPLHAADRCVATSAELEAAITAGGDAADDDIRVVTGTYQLQDRRSEARGAFRLSGGWITGCMVRTAGAVSTLNGPGGTAGFEIDGNFGGVRLERLNFTNWDEIGSRERVQGAGPGGVIALSRVRISNVRRVTIVPITNDVLVENSIFDGHTDRGLFILSSSQGDVPDVTVQFNSFVRPGPGVNDGLVINAVNSPFGSVRVYNNLINGHPRDLWIVAQAMQVNNNHYNTIAFDIGGSLAPGSGDNLTGNPLFSSSAPFRPIEPGSPLINAGRLLGASNPISDYTGAARTVGTRPDIGAVESSVENGTTLSVTNTADSGLGSLRSAILAANSATGLKTIRFDLPGACPRVISPLTALPALTEPVFINGYTQNGAVENEQDQFFDGTLCVALAGGNTIGTGLHLATQSNESFRVRGLMFYGFTSEGLRVSGSGRANVEGNLFGTGANLPNQVFANAAIRIQNAPGTIVGGTSGANMNVIGRAQQSGVRLEAALGARLVAGNLIGVDRDGQSALPNQVGVFVEDTSGDAIEGNAITDSLAQGVLFSSAAPPANVIVRDNLIGARPLNAALGGNAANAVRVYGNGHRISRNLIYNNGTDGMAVISPGRRVEITQNRFRNNAQLAIDLSPDGPNPIDLDVGQTGANDQQNKPLLTSAGGTRVAGTVRGNLSSANGTYAIDFYLSDRCDSPSGGEAQHVLARLSPLVLSCATLASNCTLPFQLAVTDALLDDVVLGGFVTAIATDEEGNSSELSDCEPWVLNDPIFASGFE